MIFSQLIERNMTWGMVVLKNHTQNAMEMLVPDRFLKSQNWAYLWIKILKFHKACFYGILSWGLSQHIETKLLTTCFYFIWSLLKKQKVWNLSPWLILCMIFWGKIFLFLYSITWPNFIVWLPLLRETLSNMCNVTVC